MNTPFKMKGWKAYTKVKNKPVKHSTTKRGAILGTESHKTKTPGNPYLNKDLSLKGQAKHATRWEADERYRVEKKVYDRFKEGE